MLLKDILLTYSNEGVNSEVILSSNVAYELYLELLEEGIEFFEEEDFENENVFSENDIVGIANSIYEDGEEEWFVQPVLADNGNTLYDDITEVVLIQDELVDCIDTESYPEAEILEFIVEEDIEEDEEEIIDLNDLADEILERLANSSCVKCEMVDTLEELLLEE